MPVTKPRKVGGPVMLAAPSAIADLLYLGAGAPVSLEMEDARLVVAARPWPRYALAVLLSRCDAEASAEDRNWTGSGPIGGEVV